MQKTIQRVRSKKSVYRQKFQILKIKKMMVYLSDLKLGTGFLIRLLDYKLTKERDELTSSKLFKRFFFKGHC